MLIRVVYRDDNFDMVKPALLDELIASDEIKKFRRSDGWVCPLTDRMRGDGGSYEGPERRRTSGRTTTGTRAHQILESLAEPMCLISPDHRIRWANRAARLILSEHAFSTPYPVCYQRFHGREIPCDGREFPCPIKSVRESGEPLTLVHQHFVAGGRVRSYEIVASPLWSDKGAFQGIVESLRDVTGRRETEEKGEGCSVRFRSPLSDSGDSHGRVPICAWCKKIRDGDGRWHTVEEYLRENFNIRFTHGMCPECFGKIG